MHRYVDLRLKSAEPNDDIVQDPKRGLPKTDLKRDCLGGNTAK